MKKSLVALAVLGGASFMIPTMPVMAQSSVTLYGVADAGVGKAKVDGDRKVHMISSGTMNNGTSRMGLRGVEDLGGGLKVGFNFESGLSLRNGGTGQSGGQFWSRQANVWIGGPWGTFQMGRALVPSFFAADTWELTDYANYSVVGNVYGFGSDIHRRSGMFVYKSPDLAGFSGQVSYQTKADNEYDGTLLNPITGERARDTNHWDVALMYNNGPIHVGASANKSKHHTTDYSVGGKYSLAMFDIAASYNSARAYNGRRGFTVGGKFHTGPFSVTLDVARDTKVAFGKKRTSAMLEGKYALSKRTFVYAAYLRAPVTNPAGVGTISYNQSTNNYGIGLRHNF